MTPDGRFVLFGSHATNLVPGPSNVYNHLFLHDVETGSTMRISQSASGEPADDLSFGGRISDDGRWIVFYSYATNLVLTTEHRPDVFLHDTWTRTTSLISRAPTGEPGNSDSSGGDISADGRYVAFDSSSSNLVAGDTNGTSDVFVVDRDSGSVRRVSVSLSGTQANGDSHGAVISADGRYVGFQSFATNLVSGERGFPAVFIHDMITGETVRIRATAAMGPWHATMRIDDLSADGRWVLLTSYGGQLPADNNPYADLYAHDRLEDRTILVSRAWWGRYTGETPPLPWANVCPIDPGPCVMAPPPYAGNSFTYGGRLSPDGRYVAFTSSASNLAMDGSFVVGGYWIPDVYVHDLQTGLTRRVTLGPMGEPHAWDSASAAIAWGARVIVYASREHPAGAFYQVYRRELGDPTCKDGWEDGRLSSPLHEVGEALPEGGSSVHLASCALAAHGW